MKVVVTAVTAAAAAAAAAATAAMIAEGRVKCAEDNLIMFSSNSNNRGRINTKDVIKGCYYQGVEVSRSGEVRRSGGGDVVCFSCKGRRISHSCLATVFTR